MKWLLTFLCVTFCFALPPTFTVPKAAQLQRSAADPFVYYSTVFDGSDAVDKTTLTGAAQSKQFTCSTWLKFTGGDGTQMGILTSLNSGMTVSPFQIFHNASDGLSIRLYNSAGTLLFYVFSEASGVFQNGGPWFHLLVSVDLAAGTYVLKTNGVNCTVTESTAPQDDFVPFAAGQFYYIGNYAGGSILQAKVSEVYFTTESQPDATKFIVSGHPKNLGPAGTTPTGTQPLIYFPNPFGTFQNNAGSGGNFSVTAGALGDGGADIP